MPLSACYAAPPTGLGGDTVGMLEMPRHDNVALVYQVTDIDRSNPKACVRLMPSAAQKILASEYGHREVAEGREETCMCSKDLVSQIVQYYYRPCDAAKTSLIITSSIQGTCRVEDAQNVVAQGGSQRPWAKENSCAGIILEVHTGWKQTKGNSKDRRESWSAQVRRPDGSSAVLPRGMRSRRPSPRCCSAHGPRKGAGAVEIKANPRNLIGVLRSEIGSADHRGSKLHTVISDKPVKLRRAPGGPGRHHCQDVGDESSNDWTRRDGPANSASLCRPRMQSLRVKREKAVMSYCRNLGEQHSVVVGRGEHPISIMPRTEVLDEARRDFRKSAIGACVTLDHPTGSPVPIRRRTRSASAAARASNLEKV